MMVAVAFGLAVTLVGATLLLVKSEDRIVRVLSSIILIVAFTVMFIEVGGLE